MDNIQIVRSSTCRMCQAKDKRIESLERQLAEARKQALKDAVKLLEHGGWYASVAMLRREIGLEG